MREFSKDPYTVIFTGPTGCGKNLLDLIEKKCNKYFDYII